MTSVSAHMASVAGEVVDPHACTHIIDTASPRICPGMQVANRSVFINTAFILWAFRVSENPAAPIDSFAFSDTANIHAMPFALVFEDRLPRADIRTLCTESI